MRFHNEKIKKQHKITLKDVFQALNKFNLIRDYSIGIDCSELNFDYVSYNSKDIKATTLFICKGSNFKVEYLKEAAKLGATAYISEEVYQEIHSNLPYIQVSDVRKAMAVIGMLYYNHPNKELNLVGITGTKGKTTTAYFMKNIFDEYYKSKSAILSSIEVYTGTTLEQSHLTTPESLDLQRYFSEARENNIKNLTMEVSSQAYKLNRVFGVNFNIGIFLNIDEDHIGPSEHVDFDDYLSCKKELMKNCDTAIINANTREFDSVYNEAKKHCERVIIYGTDKGHDYYVTNIRKQGKYTLFDVNSKNYRKTFAMLMVGRFNIENALATIIAARTLGVDEESIYNGIKNTTVKGRMNIFENNKITVIVDFAHNHLSFSKLYETIKLDYPGRRIVTVVGCAGGKAFLRRRDIGSLSGKYAQYIYLTAEDPQYEDVKEICMDIAQYIKPYKAPYEIIEDRTEAIEKAISTAKKGDVIILAAKGEVAYQKVGNEYKYYESDISIAKRCLKIKE